MSQASEARWRQAQYALKSRRTLKPQMRLRCCVHSVELCVGAGKLGMPQATDKTEKLMEDACTDGTCTSVILQRKSQTVLISMPPLDMQLLLDCICT